MMHELSTVKRFFYSVLGALFYVAYVTEHRTFWGLPWGWYIRRLLIVPVLWGLVARWESLVWWLLGLVVLVNLLYLYAARLGYSRFVAGTEELPDGEAAERIRPLSPNQKMMMRATGLFSVRDRENFVLLQPAHYWQVPLGDHVVMVQQTPKSFLYQFFDAASLQEVRAGWLIFGREPEPVLAITFRTKWAPQFAQFEIRHYVQGGVELEAPLRTIYFSFANEEERQIVWHNIVQDARRVRM